MDKIIRAANVKLCENIGSMQQFQGSWDEGIRVLYCYFAEGPDIYTEL